jgi:hypothetical protein
MLEVPYNLRQVLSRELRRERDPFFYRSVKSIHELRTSWQWRNTRKEVICLQAKLKIVPCRSQKITSGTTILASTNWKWVLHNSLSTFVFVFVRWSEGTIPICSDILGVGSRPDVYEWKPDTRTKVKGFYRKLWSGNSRERKIMTRVSQ